MFAPPPLTAWGAALCLSPVKIDDPRGPALTEHIDA